MRLELKDKSSKKFWEAEVLGSTLITRWGRIGTKGQEKQERFKTTGLAEAAHTKQTWAKRHKGYQPVAEPGACSRTATTTKSEQKYAASGRRSGERRYGPPGDQGLAALKRAFVGVKVVFAEQKTAEADTPDWRYVSVGE